MKDAQGFQRGLHKACDQIAEPERYREHQEEHAHRGRQTAHGVDNEPVDLLGQAHSGTRLY